MSEVRKKMGRDGVEREGVSRHGKGKVRWERKVWKGNIRSYNDRDGKEGKRKGKEEYEEN